MRLNLYKRNYSTETEWDKSDKKGIYFSEINNENDILIFSFQEAIINKETVCCSSCFYKD